MFTDSLKDSITFKVAQRLVGDIEVNEIKQSTGQTSERSRDVEGLDWSSGFGGEVCDSCLTQKSSFEASLRNS
jgi:hypothetical protein